MTLRETLNTMVEQLSKVLQWQAVHTEGHERLDRDVDELRETMYGNPGIKDKVLDLWRCKKQIKASRQFWFEILKNVITYTILAVIVWGLTTWKNTPALPAKDIPTAPQAAGGP